MGGEAQARDTVPLSLSWRAVQGTCGMNPDKISGQATGTAVRIMRDA